MLICFFFPTVKVLFIRKLCLKNKQLISSTIVRSLGDSERVHPVRPEIADTLMLHHYNAPCHTAISVNEFLNKKGIPVVQQPPYSPGLSPCDFFFFLFTKLKFHLKGRNFRPVVVTVQLRALPHEDFRHC